MGFLSKIDDETIHELRPTIHQSGSECNVLSQIIRKGFEGPYSD